MRISSRRNVVVHGRAAKRTDLHKTTQFECYPTGDEPAASARLRINVVGEDFKPESRYMSIELNEAETQSLLRVIAASERLRKRMLDCIVENTATGY